MAASPPVFANDGSFFDKFKNLQQPDYVSSEPEQAASSSREPLQPPADDAENQQKQDADFVPSSSFDGARDGYAFTTGDQGTGYYKDTPLHIKAKAKAKPVALKTNNSIIKGLQRRTAVAPDPKRQKKDDSSSKPSYLKEMERYKAMSCTSDTKHDRPLVK